MIVCARLMIIKDFSVNIECVFCIDNRIIIVTKTYKIENSVLLTLNNRKSLYWNSGQILNFNISCCCNQHINFSLTSGDIWNNKKVFFSTISQLKCLLTLFSKVFKFKNNC